MPFNAWCTHCNSHIGKVKLAPYSCIRLWFCWCKYIACVSCATQRVSGINRIPEMWLHHASCVKHKQCNTIRAALVTMNVSGSSIQCGKELRWKSHLTATSSTPNLHLPLLNPSLSSVNSSNDVDHLNPSFSTSAREYFGSGLKLRIASFPHFLLKTWSFALDGWDIERHTFISVWRTQIVVAKW